MKKTHLFNASFKYTDRGSPCFKHRIHSKHQFVYFILHNRKKSHTDTIYDFSNQSTDTKKVDHLRKMMCGSHTSLNIMHTQNYSNGLMCAWIVIDRTSPVYSLTSKLLISYPDCFGFILAIW